MPADYKVGYGKPPKETRFRKGVSGNPRGRPKKPKPTLGEQQLREGFRDALLKPARIKRGDSSEEVPAYQAILLQLVTKAAHGDYRAIKLVLDRLQKIGDGNDPEPETWADLVREVVESGELDDEDN